MLVYKIRTKRHCGITKAIESKGWLPGMDSNHEETGSSGLNKLLILSAHISGISRNRPHSYSIRTRWEAAGMPCGRRSDHLESDEQYLWLVAAIPLVHPLVDLKPVRECAPVTFAV